MGYYVHGDSHNRLYKIYRGMLSRCNNKNHQAFDRYGGNGIKVCDEWESNYLTFKNWALSHGYSHNLTIDRIDNTKGYSPDNCRWITKFEQESNKTTNINILINNEIHTMTEWCRQYGIRRDTAWKRIKSGWDPAIAVSTPARSYRTKTTEV